MNTSFQRDIFFEIADSRDGPEEPSFLNIDDIFDEPLFRFSDEPSPAYEAHCTEEPLAGENSSAGEVEQSSGVAAKVTFKSSYNKNVCYNICQKTIKVIKKGDYEAELLRLCASEGVQPEKFKAELVRDRQGFTGPKALGAYIERESPESRVLAGFMRWFLTEKYLRLALNEGEMKDIRAYIEYKNQVILPLLQ